jgi:protein gp37
VEGLSLEPLWERIPSKKFNFEGINWSILGGERGRREFVRPFDLSWAREIRDYCQQQGVFPKTGWEKAE